MRGGLSIYLYIYSFLHIYSFRGLGSGKVVGDVICPFVLTPVYTLCMQILK